MTSYQSRLGGEEGIAEELAQSQRSISIAEFFEKNKHMLGFDSDARALVTAVKEGVDNSLDACEEAGILPDVYVEIQNEGEYYRLIIEDNGPGITKEQIPKIFGKLLYGSRFHKREQSLTPDQTLLVKRNNTIECLPIGRLCDAYLPPDGETTAPIPDDIEVPSFNRESHGLTWQPVTHAIRHETDGQLYRITTEKGRTVEVTGDHSLFTATKDGETKELQAKDIDTGDVLLTPKQIPTPQKETTEVNLLEHITSEQLDERCMYVSGFDQGSLEALKQGETVRKRSSETNRERTYYRYDGVDVRKDSLDENYIPDGYLPAETVLELGWEDRATDCWIKTPRAGGEETTVPVTVTLTPAFMRLLGDYLAGGHAGDSQAEFTSGSPELGPTEPTATTIAAVDGKTTTRAREGNSTRVNASASPFSAFFESVCGCHAQPGQVPPFVFETDRRLQQEFLTALYQGDGSDPHPGNEMTYTTTSETLARQLSVLWSMQGVLASTEVATNAGGYAAEHQIKVDGEDVSLLDGSGATKTSGKQGYKQIPTTLLDDVRVGQAARTTVPDTISGLLLGAGVGSNLEHAVTYRSVIEDALAGAYVDPSRDAHDLTEMGLLDEDSRPTELLEQLWETVQTLHGFTDSDMCLLPVTDVEAVEPTEYVYDISVPGATGYDENFVVVNDGPLSVKNSRGQQGIGISAAVLYAQLTSGKPAKITSRTQSSEDAQYFEVIVDTDTNEPEISVEETTTWERPHGTRIELEMEANMRARKQLHDYIMHTAVVNPHARVELREPRDQFKYERTTDQLPAETEEIRPHPHGVELGTLIKMAESTDSYSISGFVQEEFTRVGQKTADSVIDAFRDRYYGREMAWQVPGTHETADIETAVEAAVANKGADATADFATRVAKRLIESDRTAKHQVIETVDGAADEVQTEYGTTFGNTVRERAVEAAWETLTAERESDIYALVDESTTTRKDDAVVQALAERLAAKFEPGERHRLVRDEFREYVDRAADMTEDRDDATVGDTARENILETLWGTAVRVPDDPPRVREVAEDRDTASELLDAMRSVDIISPPTGCLSPITADLVEAGLQKGYDADFYAASTRDAAVHGGDPFIVEAGIAYGGEIDEGGTAEVLRFANRVPLVYQRGACATTDVVKGINWRNYGLDQPGGSGIPNGPAVIMVHVASTNVPFTSESKDALANIPEIEDEIELAIREAARELKSYLNRRRSVQQRREKQDKLATILPEMAKKLSAVTGRESLDIDGTLARIMNDVLVQRERDGADVRLIVENNDDTNVSLEVTEIVTEKPEAVNGATVVEMDGEWFLKWEPTVSSGERSTLVYELQPDADCSISVDGIEAEKMTIDT